LPGQNRVLVLGAGYVAGPAVEYLARDKNTHVTVGRASILLIDTYSETVGRASVLIIDPYSGIVIRASVLIIDLYSETVSRASILIIDSYSGIISPLPVFTP